MACDITKPVTCVTFRPDLPISAPDLLARFGFLQGKVKIDGPQTPRKSGKIDTEQRKLCFLSFFVDDSDSVWSIPLVADERRTIKTNKPHNHETRHNSPRNHRNLCGPLIHRGIRREYAGPHVHLCLLNKPQTTNHKPIMKQGNQASNIWGNLANPLPSMSEKEWMESAQKYLNKTANSTAWAAITAKYIGATETRGSRVKVTSQRGSRVFPYPHECSRDEVFSHCVAQYLEFIRHEDRKAFSQPEHDGWGTIADYAMGVLPSGDHVFVSVR